MHVLREFLEGFLGLPCLCSLFQRVWLSRESNTLYHGSSHCGDLCILWIHLPFWLWVQNPCCIIIFTVLINSCSCFPPGFHLPPNDLLGDYIVQMVDAKVWTWTLKFLLNLIAAVMVWGCGTFRNELGLRSSIIRNRVTALSLEQLSLLESSIVIVALVLLIK